MRLYRETPPDPNPRWGEWWIGSAQKVTVDGVFVLNGASEDALWTAIEKAAAVVWGGQQWMAGIEHALGVRAGTVKRWRRDGGLPPGLLVAWLAYLRQLDDARAVGHAILALTMSDHPDTIRIAAAAHAALRKPPA